MTAAIATPTQALFRFVEVDHAVSAEERCYFSPPANKRAVDEQMDLHDVRSASSTMADGLAGLDAQVFTYVRHSSALVTGEGQFFTHEQIEKDYIPEIEALVCKITGARQAVVNNVTFRRKRVKMQEDLSFYVKKGSEIDQNIGKLPRDTAMILGVEAEQSIEPARGAHIDYSLKGLRDSARFCRGDIKAAAQLALDAEDTTGVATAPRYAAFSVWRPLKTIHRDPLAVCDWRTVSPSTDLEGVTYRALSGVAESGEYMMSAWSMRPPSQEAAARQQWYWMPSQTPEDVLVIKFADTMAESDQRVAGGCPHCAVALKDADQVSEDPRESIEARVFAFW